jgi:glycosyltransferase involved in cell wall biosynthesis
MEGGNSRRILMIARQFPPIGGAGVHRSLGSVRHLPEHGYEVSVVTGPGRRVDRWTPEDPVLLATVPEGTEIHRLEGPEPPGSTGWTGRAERWLQRPGPWLKWWLDGTVRLGSEAGAGADLIYVACAPYETAWAGARLSRRLGIPWVADLEDPWAVDEMRVHPTALHRLNDLRRMRGALASAAAIVTCAPETAAQIKRVAPSAGGGRVAAIPIGFESDAAKAEPAPHGDAFRIVHTGSLHTELGLQHRRSARMRRLLGGSSLDVDILTRSHVFLLQAVDRVLAARPDTRIEVVLAGDLTAGDEAAIGARPYVTRTGRLAHDETAALMRSADLLFLPMQELPPGRRATLIPYKTYEYLAAERPILAAVPDGDVRDMLAPLEHASVVRPPDVAAMAAAIEQWIARAPAADAPPQPELERRRLVGRIAAVLDDVLR